MAWQTMQVQYQRVYNLFSQVNTADTTKWMPHLETESSDSTEV